MGDRHSSDHRGLKLQNIIQKLSEHCDVKNPLDLDNDDDNNGFDEFLPQKREKQKDGVIASRWDTKPQISTDVDEVIQLYSKKVKIEDNVLQSNTESASTRTETPPLHGRISTRIQNLKLKKLAGEDEKLMRSEQLEPRHLPQKARPRSPEHSSPENSTKIVTRKRRRKKKESLKSSGNVISVEDYVNEAPVIQVGNLVGVRQCRLCSVMFVEKEQLISHMKAVHHLDDKVRISDGIVESLQGDCFSKDDKPFKCSQCLSSFGKSSGLKQHVTRQHSQNAPQRSSHAHCAASLSAKNHGPSDRPYSCQVCGKAFKRKHHLQEHSYIHSDEKPYKCDTCNKTFNQRICLTKHLPCREHEKQQKKPPNITKTPDARTRRTPKKRHLNQGNIREQDSSVNGNKCDLTYDMFVPGSPNSCDSHAKAPEISNMTVNGNECNGKTLDADNIASVQNSYSSPSQERQVERNCTFDPPSFDSMTSTLPCSSTSCSVKINQQVSASCKPSLQPPPQP